MLEQLCKHFGYKRPVSFGALAGRIEFEAGICELAAPEEQNCLILRLHAQAAAHAIALKAITEMVAEASWF